ncbi:hypothetical protein ACE38V_06905 [Cytobacillus sp. Hz8]|uniref:hypothetical protein n=1 Tax=Cytobacillus sp. Hz8 TaxID=3347168 RepID=UPI0035D6F68F
MVLKNADLMTLFPKNRGYISEKIIYKTVALRASSIQPKGLFFPIFSDSGELKEAIRNGAIAAVWNEEKSIPPYTPNDFPIFLTNDLLKGLLNMIKLYLDKLEENKFNKNELANFLFEEDNLLHHEETKNIAVIAQQLQQSIEQIRTERRG